MVDQPKLPGDISAPTRIEPTMPVGEEGKDPGSFASLMDKKSPDGIKHSQISPMDLAHVGSKPMGTPNNATLLSQVDLAHSTLSTVQNQLSAPNLKLKSSQKYLVKNKLMDANTNLRMANSKLGSVPDSPSVEKGSGPLSQYLNYVADGMNQIESAKESLTKMSAQGTSLSPAEYMLVQLKISKAQQELDFTSILLAKAVEGFKLVMNVQV